MGISWLFYFTHLSVKSIAESILKKEAKLIGTGMSCIPTFNGKGKGKWRESSPLNCCFATPPAVSIALQSRGIFLIMNTVHDQYHKCCGQQKTVKQEKAPAGNFPFLSLCFSSAVQCGDAVEKWAGSKVWLGPRLAPSRSAFCVRYLGLLSSGSDPAGPRSPNSPGWWLRGKFPRSNLTANTGSCVCVCVCAKLAG